MEKSERAMSVTERWNASRPTKTALFWSCVASAAVTMIIGFTWGGWIRGVTAQNMAELGAEAAVVKHLTPICVAQFEQDAGKEQKLRELKALSTYERDDYVRKQGWAKMPGAREVDDQVVDACAKVIAR